MMKEIKEHHNGKSKIQEQKKAGQSPSPTRDWEETYRDRGEKSKRWDSR